MPGEPARRACIDLVNNREFFHSNDLTIDAKPYKIDSWGPGFDGEKIPGCPGIAGQFKLSDFPAGNIDNFQNGLMSRFG